MRGIPCLLACSEARNNSLTMWNPFYSDAKYNLKLRLEWLRRLYAPTGMRRLSRASATRGVFVRRDLRDNKLRSFSVESFMASARVLEELYAAAPCLCRRAHAGGKAAGTGW